MSGEKKPIFKKRKWLMPVFLATLIFALTVIVLSLIPGKQPGRSVLAEMFAPRTPAITVSELHFNVGRNRMFAHSGGSVAAVGTLGLQMLGPDGRQIFSDSFRMSAPALVENNGHFIAFDIGGTGVRVFDGDAELTKIETEDTIVSASINKNGWFCIVTQREGGGTRGIISVYDNSGEQVFWVNIGSGFVVSAKLSDDGKFLAILNIADTGSRFTCYNGIDTDKDDPDIIHTLGGEIFFDFDFLTGTNVIAYSTQAVLTLDLSSQDRPAELCAFGGKKLGGYTHTDEFVALHLYDYSIGYSGQITTFSFDGTVLGTLDTAMEIASMASLKGTLMVLWGDGVTFFNKQLEELPLSETALSAATAGRVLALSEDMALAANDLTAIVIRRGD